MSKQAASNVPPFRVDSSPTSTESLRVMTYNTHACRGIDGKVDVERVAWAILQEDPDLVCLQELDVNDPRSGRTDQPELLAELTGRSVHYHAARSSGASSFGNATLCRHPFELVHQAALPKVRDEARAAHCLRVQFPSGAWVHLVNTHLSIRFSERLAQIRAIFSDDLPPSETEELFGPLVAPYRRLVLCGDLNAGGWSPVAHFLHRVLRDVQDTNVLRRRNTWPSALPLLRLDHIWVGPEISIEGVRVPRQGPAKNASDHLPLVADLRVPYAED